MVSILAYRSSDINVITLFLAGLNIPLHAHEEGEMAPVGFVGLFSCFTSTTEIWSLSQSQLEQQDTAPPCKCLISHFLVHHSQIFDAIKCFGWSPEGRVPGYFSWKFPGCQVAKSFVYLLELQLTDLWCVEILLNRDKGESFQIENFFRGVCTGKWVLLRTSKTTT